MAKSKPLVSVPRLRVYWHVCYRLYNPVAGWAVRTKDGDYRFLTFWETVLYKLFGLGPKK